MKRKTLLFGCILLTLILSALPFMTSCAQPAPAPSPAPAPAPKPAPAPAPAPTPAPAPAPAPDKVYKFRMQVFAPPTEVVFKVGAMRFAEKVREATKGRIEITPYPGGALVKAPEIFKSVADGTIDMGVSAAGYHIGFMPFAAVPDGLPMSWRSAADILEVNKRGLLELTQTEYEKRGVHYLNGAIAAVNAILSKKPLRTKADFQGAKIRGWGAWNTYFGKLGASPVDVPLTEVYLGLSMGTFDGAITGTSAHYDLKHYEVAKYMMVPSPLEAMTHDYTINLKTWNALPADLRDILTKVAREHELYMSTDFYKEHMAPYVDKLKAAGVQPVEVDKETWAWMTEKAVELWNEYAAKDPVAAKAVKLMTDYMKEKGYIK